MSLPPSEPVPFRPTPRPWADEPADGPPPRRQPRWLLPLVGVLVVLATVAGFRWLPTDPARAEAGDCVELSDVSLDSATVRVLDCSDTAAIYQVTNTVSSVQPCAVSLPTLREGLLPTEGPTEADAVPAADPTEVVVDRTKLCLQLDLEQGECIAQGSGGGYRSAACTDPDAELQVARRVPDQDDSTLCGDLGADLAGVVHYPRHPLTYCFVAPSGV